MTSTQSRPGSARSLAHLIPTPKNASALYLLGLTFLVFGLTIPETFLTSATLNLVFSAQAVAGVVALAVLIPFVAGAFDLSVGSMVAFSLVIVAHLQQDSERGIVFSCVVALLACAVVGLCSGIIVVIFHVNSFIATLGMGQLLTAASLYLSSNKQIVGVFPSEYLSAGQGNWLGLPRAFWYLIVIGIVIWYVLEWTPLGRRLFATGSNVEAARLAGIRTNPIIIGSLVASATVAGLGGIILGAQVGSFSNSVGPPLLFPAFAALFFGATQFKNRPNVWGTLVAVFALAFGVQGLQLTFTGGVYWLTPAFNGAALLIAVAFAARSGRIPLKKKSEESPSIVPDERPTALQK